ncbi:DUF1810 family protein [Sphingobium sp. SYK-6]|uniref:DUF1810 family protein n=1 Tax=Sphingobium sp. (strain NBRC 103272 / SYK-6) TaxID=627192 RepID=UPI0022B244AF|nr:DUF1810 family protein [Sphingobium sp. SYK-6]
MQGNFAGRQHFAIRSRDEVRAFLNHPVLGPHCRKCVRAFEDLRTGDSAPVLGTLDADVKIAKCLDWRDRICPALPLTSLKRAARRP